MDKIFNSAKFVNGVGIALALLLALAMIRLVLEACNVI